MISISESLKQFGLFDEGYQTDWKRLSDNPYCWERPEKMRVEELQRKGLWLGDWFITDSKSDYWYADLVGCEFFGAARIYNWRRPDGVDQPYVYDVRPARAVGRVWWELGRSIGGDNIILV